MQTPDNAPKDQEPLPFKFNKEEVEKIKSNDSYRGYLLDKLFETLDQEYTDPIRAVALLERARTYSSLLKDAKKTTSIVPRSTSVKL